MLSEAILCIKNARELFERTQAINIIVWLLIQLIISVIFVYGCILYHRYKQVQHENSLALLHPKNNRMLKKIQKLFRNYFDNAIFDFLSFVAEGIT